MTCYIHRIKVYNVVWSSDRISNCSRIFMKNTIIKRAVSDAKNVGDNGAMAVITAMCLVI